jgi:GNAT superfamily N-acetyltransferase
VETDASSDVRASIIDALCLFGGRPRPSEEHPVVQTATPGAEGSAQHCATISGYASTEPSAIYSCAREVLRRCARTHIWVPAVTQAGAADYLWRQGCSLGYRVLGMRVTAERWSSAEPPRIAGATMIWVRTAQQAELFRELRRGFREPGPYVDFFARDGVLLSERCDAVVAVDEPGGPCAGGMVVYSADFSRAGLYWPATNRENRRRGIGTAVAAALTDRAVERGCRSVSLQATPMGVGVYESLGFTPVEPIDRFLLSVQDR